MIYEYDCNKCHQTFIGDGAPREEHFGCAGMGTLVAIDGDPVDWHPLTSPR